MSACKGKRKHAMFSNAKKIEQFSYARESTLWILLFLYATET
jgi:hypothetical protein